MSVLDDKINSLSSDELDLLNSDPKLLSDFKTKYGGPEPAPKWYEIEKQQGLPKTAGDFLKQAGSGVLDAVTSPFPGISELTMAPKMLSQASQQGGADVARATEPSIGTVPARVAGMATSMATDPLSYAPIGDAVKPVFNPIKEAVAAKLPGIFQGLAKIPESSTETFLKEGGKLPEYSKEAAESITAKVQGALEKAVNEHGANLNAAKEAVGLPTSPEAKVDSIKKYGNEFGLTHADLMKTSEGEPFATPSFKWADQGNQQYYKLFGDKGQVEALTKGEHTLASDVTAESLNKHQIPIKQSPFLQDFKQPHDLAVAIDDFKQQAPQMSETARVKTASYLQDKINNFVDWNKTGNSVQGILKTQYDDLKDIGIPSSLQSAKSGMTDALNVLNTLQKKVGQEPGKAYDYLEKMFTSDKASAQDGIAKLAKLEAVSGVPVLSDLYKHFASKSFSKYASRPGFETVELAHGLSAAAAGYPKAALGILAALGVQSPKLLGKAAQIASKGPSVASKLASLSANTAVKGGFPLNSVSPSSYSVLQSVKDRMSNNMVDFKDSKYAQH